MTGLAFLSSLTQSRETPGPIAIGLGIGILFRFRPQRPPNTPVTAHELSPEKSAELAAWARTVGIDVDPKANELEQWPKVIMGFVSKGIEVADAVADRGATAIQPRAVNECARKDWRSSTPTFAWCRCRLPRERASTCGRVRQTPGLGTP